MDKLNEPSFDRDRIWPRYLLGVDEAKKNKAAKYPLYFGVLAGASIYRYWREITFYRNNWATFALIAPAFLFSSYMIARTLTTDPYIEAAETNNIKEKDFINEYRSLYKDAKRKGIEIPDHLIK
jgi:hypothetical protein